MHMTPRELVRRWYGQIKGQPETVANQIKDTVAHTIVPSFLQSVFGPSDFAPLSGCLDLVLHSDPGGALVVRGYRASYDIETNKMTIGGADNLQFVKDLKQRPFKGAEGSTIDSETESAILLAGLEMEAEREASMRCDAMLRYPRWSSAVMSFNEDTAPGFEATMALRHRALQYVCSDEPMRALCAPKGYKGKVRRVLRDSRCGVTVIELTEADGVSACDCVVEVPSWANVYVRQGHDVRSEMPLASMALPERVLEPMYRANRTTELMWSAVNAYIGERDALMLLHKVWNSEVLKWAGMTMVPNYLLEEQHLHRASGVWRDLRYGLGRVCHSHRNPSEVIRNGLREGRLSVWRTEAVEESMMSEGLSGPVDLFSV